MARPAIFGMTMLLAGGLLACAGALGTQSCADAKAVSRASSRIDQVWLGFGLDLEGRVTSGCAARNFALHDPIHMSIQVSDAAAGSVVRVSIRDVVSHRIAWSEDRPVPAGRSHQTFRIGRELAAGRYRAEPSLGGDVASPWEFAVHGRPAAVRRSVGLDPMGRAAPNS